MLPIEPHDEFLALCAISTSGELTEEEQKRLQEHLAGCPSCREALAHYNEFVDRVIPGVAAGHQTENLDLENADPGPSFSQDAAEMALFEHLDEERKHEPRNFGRPTPPRSVPPGLPLPPSAPAWRQTWLLVGAGILLVLSFELYAYRIGRQHAAEIAAHAPPPVVVQRPIPLEEQLSDASHDRELVRSQIGQRDQTIADLRHQLAHQSSEISQLKVAQERLESDLHADAAAQQDLMQQRSELAQKLQAAQTSSQALETKLQSLAEQSAEDVARARASEGKISELTRQLQEHTASLEQQGQLLAHDRDIRELMGARDLYIAEVYDVAGDGQTKKPYGRVFYTRGKSLIFYAYDLDQQAEVRNANTFQAWGRRGPDRQQAVNLGILYEDNISKKRWILKCDDSEMLAQLDAVFVTVEPNGGSHKPSSKPLLFAYLKVNPNHP